MSEADDEYPAPGWDAIDQALLPIYGDQEPLHYASVPKFILGGSDPLDGISIYRAERPIPHWHWATYGFTELYEKEGENPDYSGFGFELTFRLRRSPEETEPPAWAYNFLQNLARYVFKTGNVFGEGHHLPLNSPIALGQETRIWAAMFVRDPELGVTDSPNGRFEFLQVVGITVDELNVAKEWDASSFLEILGRVTPNWITDLARGPIMEDPAIDAGIRERARQEGSSTANLLIDPLEICAQPGGAVCVSFATTAVDGVRSLLRGRIPNEAPAVITGGGVRVEILPVSEPYSRLDGTTLTLGLTPELALSIADALVRVAGDYSWPELPGVIIRVIPSQIEGMA